MDTIQPVLDRLKELVNTETNSLSVSRTTIIYGVSLPATLLVLRFAYKRLTTIPDPPDEMPEYKGYDAMDIAAPSLSGLSLKFFRHLLEMPFIGTFIGSVMYKMNGFYEVHHLAYNCPSTPTHLPFKVLNKQEMSYHENCANAVDYTQFLQSFDLINQLLGHTDNNPNNSSNNSHNSDNSGADLITIEAIYNAYKQGSKTPLDIITQALSNAKKLSHLRIFTQFPNEEDVMNAAKLSTERWKENKPLSILDGIPIAIKDQFEVFNTYHTKGTLFLKDGKTMDYNKEGLLIRRLRKLGAILFGKTNLHEIGIQPNGYNPHYGTCNNPYSRTCSHNTGGSSSGSACAVASQLVPLAIGADAGGSIRTPAGMCGVFGIKASYGRVPFTPNHQTSVWAMVHNGCLGNTLKDEIIGYMAIAGDPTPEEMKETNEFGKVRTRSFVNDAIAPPLHLTNVNRIDNNDSKNGNKSDKNITIGVYWDWFNDSQAEMREGCKKVLDLLTSEYGMTIKDIIIPFMGVLSKAHAITTLGEWLTTDWKYVNKGDYCDSTQLMLSFAKNYKAQDYVSAQVIKTYILDYLDNEVFNECDVIITPACTMVADQYYGNNAFIDIFDSEVMSKLMKFAHFGNYTGIPAMSVPVGYTNVDGSGNKLNDGTRLPISMQIMSKHWNEHVIFRIANIIEQRILKRELPPLENRAVYDL